ncbi:MAG: DNA polymerase III subunit delta [Cardiobacteriaceae bacterium]|nr:DNA polymerase III subunit delta [Cardiobacteriaceae bacterium]
MKITADDSNALQSALNSSPTVVLIHGDEPQLNLEALDTVRQYAHDSGFTERTVYFSDQSSWETLKHAWGAISLFATKRLLEWHVMEDKLPKAFGDFINQINNQAKPDIFLILYASELDKPDNLAYYKALCQHQLVIVSKKLYPKAFHQQIDQRLQRAKLRLNAEALHVLLQSYEGNLVAAQQAISRLTLLPHAHQILTTPDIMPVLSDQAQFSLYTLSDALLLADWKRALWISQHFAQDPSSDSKHKFPIILTAQLHKDTTLLLSLQADNNPDHHQALFQAYKIPNFKQRLYYDALRKHSLPRLRATLKICAKLDLVLKGGMVGDYWHQLCQYLIHCLSH